MRTRPALFSIHDVEPQRLDRVLRLADLLDEAGIPSPTLLVVPGMDWRARDLDVVRSLVDRGYDLAGHGWSHRAPEPKSLRHRIHAVILSRDQGEHLSRGRRTLMRRVRACHAWFDEVDLPRPALYVPPAWAMGRLRERDLAHLPFDWFETLTGVTCPRARIRMRLPLVGFEADTIGREWGLRVWNRVHPMFARPGRPVRVAIHPDDLELRLADQLREMVSGGLLPLPMRPWLERKRAVAIGATPAAAPVS